MSPAASQPRWTYRAARSCILLSFLSCISDSNGSNTGLCLMRCFPRWSSGRYLSLILTTSRRPVSLPPKAPRFLSFPQRYTTHAIPQSGGFIQEHNRKDAHTFGTFSADSSTIFALSTAPGRAAIAIVRISGPACLDVSTTKFEAGTAVNLF